MNEKRSINLGALCTALDAQRRAKNMSWRGVAAEAGVSATLFVRLSQGRQPSLFSYLALTGWLDCSAEDFVEGLQPRDEKAQRTVEEVSRYLHADKLLDREKANVIDSLVRSAYNALTS